MIGYASKSYDTIVKAQPSRPRPCSPVDAFKPNRLGFHDVFGSGKRAGPDTSKKA